MADDPICPFCEYHRRLIEEQEQELRTLQHEIEQLRRERDAGASPDAGGSPSPGRFEPGRLLEKRCLHEGLPVEECFFCPGDPRCSTPPGSVSPFPGQTRERRCLNQGTPLEECFLCPGDSRCLGP